MSSLSAELAEQRISNRSGLPYFEAFSGHRARLTALILANANAATANAATANAASASEANEAPRGSGRLCVLGAGNCFDLDLPLLLERFAELHLVDIDAEAVQGARARLAADDAERVLVHAPLDLSGLFQDVERWGRMQVTVEELFAAPAAGARRIATALPAPFDVVVSACLLTQLQLTLLKLLGDRHQLFGALRELLTLTHLRALAALSAPGGCALLVTDLCDSSAFPPGRPRDDADLPALMDELVAARTVIHSAHPELLKLTLADDPVLARSFEASRVSPPWTWQNGPERTFLVYGLELPRQR